MTSTGADGSPRARNPEQKKQRILDAAIDAFAEGGKGTARVDDIASRAGVNKQLLYRYFGDKDSLFLKVIDEFIRRSESALSSLPRSVMTSVETVFRNIHADARFTRLMAFEALETSGPVVGEPRRTEQLRRFAQQHASPQTALTVFGAAAIARLLPQFARMLCGVEVDDSTFVEARAAHLQELGALLGPHSTVARYLYVGSDTVEADLAFYEDTFGTERVWAFDRFGAKVGALALGSGPLLVLASHRPRGEMRVLYACDLVAFETRLAAAGIVTSAVELPAGRAILAESPGGVRFGLVDASSPKLLERAFADVENKHRLIRHRSGR